MQKNLQWFRVRSQDDELSDTTVQCLRGYLFKDVPRYQEYDRCTDEISQKGTRARG